MKRRVFGILGLALVFAVTMAGPGAAVEKSTASGVSDDESSLPNPGIFVWEHAAELGLDETQVKKLQDLARSTFDASQGQRARLAREREVLQRLIQEDAEIPRIKAQLDKVALMRSESTLASIVVAREAGAILTVDQRRQWATICRTKKQDVALPPGIPGGKQPD